MPTTPYTVKSGDTLWAIGQKFSMPWEKIWNAPENAEFKKNRGNPNILYPGDELIIPDLELREESGETEKTHRFRRPGRARIRIAVLDLMHKPMKGVPYSFARGDEVLKESSTDADGIAELKLPPGSRTTSLTLTLPWGDYPVEVGELDPANTIRGIQQRLTNLGIPCGPIDGLIGPLTRGGIASFQKIEELDPTGEPDETTIKELRSRHDGESLGSAEELEEHPPPRHDAPGQETSVDGNDDDDLFPDAEAFYANFGIEPAEIDDGG